MIVQHRVVLDEKLYLLEADRYYIFYDLIINLFKKYKNLNKEKLMSMLSVKN
jgi:hypothetical protein